MNSQLIIDHRQIVATQLAGANRVILTVRPIANVLFHCKGIVLIQWVEGFTTEWREPCRFKELPLPTGADG